MGLVGLGRGWVVTGEGLLWTDDNGGHWRNITPPVSGSPLANIAAVTFLDSTIGWAAVDVPEGRSGLVIQRTTDGGRTWAAVRLPGQFLDGFGGAGLSFVDQRTGYVVVGLPHGGGLLGRALLFATGDGGVTWRQVGTESAVDQGVRFVTGDRGWGLDSVGHLYRTSDAGNTWVPVVLVAPGGSGQTSSFGLPTFFGADGVVLGQVDYGVSSPKGVVVYTTHDGGNTWQPGRPPDGVDIAHYGGGVALPFAASDARHWLLYVGPDIYATDDAGTNWTTVVPNLSWQAVRAIAFPTQLSGWALITSGVCASFKSNCSTQSVLLRTADGGSHWSFIPPPSVK